MVILFYGGGGGAMALENDPSSDNSFIPLTNSVIIVAQKFEGSFNAVYFS